MKRALLALMLAAGLASGAAAQSSVNGYLNFRSVTVTVTTSPTLLAPQRARNAVTIYNPCGVALYVDGPTVNTSSSGSFTTGALTVDTQAAVYGVVASGSCAVTVWETY